MRIDSVLAVYRKELLDLVRDRRTLISMVLVPIAAVPLLMTVIGFFTESAEKKADQEALTVAVHNAERVPGLLNVLAAAKFRFADKTDLKGAVEKKEVAVGIDVVPGELGKPEIRIFTDGTRQASSVAAGNIRSALNGFLPFKVKTENLAKNKMAGMVWGSVLGYVVVLLMFSGGMYPAIDLTAGEKERRTLEVLLSAPVRRADVILGKMLATTTAVFVTAVLTIGSLAFSLRSAHFGKALKTIGTIPIDGPTLALVLVALLPMAVLAASLMIAIALFAKSFKEAQSYLTPLVMAAVFPLIVGFIPGIQLTPALAAIPLFNVCQLIKEIFQGSYSSASFAVTMVANVAYAAIAFYGAVRVFENENVLFRT